MAKMANVGNAANLLCRAVVDSVINCVIAAYRLSINHTSTSALKKCSAG